MLPQDRATFTLQEYSMQDKVIKEAVLIQNLVEDQSARNLEVVSQLTSYVESVQKTFQQFVDGLEEGIEEHLEEKEPESAELQKLYTYLKRLVRQLIRISKGVQNTLTKTVLDELHLYTQHLQEQNNKIYETLCNHYKETAVAYKMRDFKPDIEDIYNPIFKQRDILNRSREKYKLTLGQFESVNSDYLEFTRDHLKRTIRAVNELLMMDGVQKYLSNPEMARPLTPEPIILELTSQVEYQLGASKLLVLHSNRPPTFSQTQAQIQQFIVYLLSSTVLQFKNYEQTRSMILGDEKQSMHFMTQFSQSLKTDINVGLDKYHDIQSMIKFIFATDMQSEKPSEELLINVLRVASKVRSNGKWMLKEFKNYQGYWKDQTLWKKVYQHIRKSKQSNNIKHYIKKLKKIYNNKWMKMRRIPANTSTNDQDVALEIIREISMYLAGLELDNQFVVQLLISLCKNEEIQRAEIEKLIKYQHSNKKQQLNHLYLSSKTLKSEKDKWMSEHETIKLVVGVGMALRFLSVDEGLLELRLVSKEWNRELTREIQRRYLEQEQNPQLQHKYRLQMYLMVSSSQSFSQEAYKTMKSQVPSDFQYRQIIALDVRRSLQWNPALQTLLSQILSIFAHNYPDTGYLQGMNYIVEHLLKLTTKPHYVYKIFEHLMRTHYYHYYDNNFALIRLRIYQLIRLIEIYIPELARHFEKEKIEGEYFLLPWAITLWGEYQGELAWVMSDGFVIDGWLWWMKVCLWVMNEKKEEFLQKGFESIMKFFTELMTDKNFSSSLTQKGRKIREQIQRFKVTQELLGKIEKQYTGSTQKIQELLDSKH